MKINLAPAMGLLLVLAACGSDSEVPPPPETVGMEAPSDTPSRNSRIAGRWLSTATSVAAGAIRLEIAGDGTYRMKMLQSRSSLVEAIVSASAGDMTWSKAGFLHGRDEHPSPEMDRFGRWTAGFEGDAARIVLAPEKGAPVVFERESES
jgi:hypothetical protein